MCSACRKHLKDLTTKTSPSLLVTSPFNLAAAAKVGNPLGQRQSTIPERAFRTALKRSVLAPLPHFKLILAILNDLRS